MHKSAYTQITSLILISFLFKVASIRIYIPSKPIFQGTLLFHLTLARCIIGWGYSYGEIVIGRRDYGYVVITGIRQNLSFEKFNKEEVYS